MTRTTRPPRRGFTLFEVLLVAALLVVVAALVYPSLKGSYGYYKLQGGIDSVRAAWAQARARAIEEGRPYRFSVESGGSHYRVAPDQGGDSSGAHASGNDSHGHGLVLEKALPAGVTFSTGGGAAPPAENTSTRDVATPA